ncbi:Ger(x)C family spore germination protein [Paenibacillus cymbidii]|uniref:Ger(x)C family spore germination protein n=1 Tax=Paenibacillus cymbidii TaxID=1639034 RepID=UPI001080D24A|nr:Ger(x)C family spore germination C-terminal domain-containing protein [Paenibacillus cymbidii]
MKAHRLLAPLAAIALLLAGCGDRIDLEDASTPFALGYDIGDDKRLRVYAISAVFSPHAKQTSVVVSVPSETARQAREQLDIRSSGIFNGRKLQIVLVGKRVLEQDSWFRLTDAFFRDSRDALNQRVAVCDCSLADLMRETPSDEPMLPLLLKGMIDSGSKRAETANTSLLELKRQMDDPAVTPAIAEFRFDEHNKIMLSGTALLDHRGKYAASLGLQESVLLRVLQKEARNAVGFTVEIPGQPDRSPFVRNRLSFNSERIHTRIRLTESGRRFRFAVRIRMPIILTERLFPFDSAHRDNELERTIGEQTQAQIDRLIRRIQQDKLDPFGFGLYARAYAYRHFQAVKNDWGDAFSNAVVDVSVRTSIVSDGPID